jgi:cysteinyl-tRNA synthetase
MELQLYNTRTGRKDPFTPLDPQRVTMYVCGPTAYARVHIGNGLPAVVFDVLYRLLRVLYPRVDYARNFTDIDDKINAAAAAIEEPIAALATRFTAAYVEDFAALGVLAPTIEPRATDHIDEIVAMIERLIERGHAYENAGHVLFNVPSDPQYGTLSRRSLEDMLDGARVEVAPYKQDPKDFVLWKPSTPELPGWDSPWGRGRPGWHIECSAMIRKHLGETIDIHGGGSDLTFPHHENEAAQSRCANDADEYVRFWLHNGMLTLGDEKMSKSVGNIVTIRELLERYPGEVLRYALLSGKYRQQLAFSDALLEQAAGCWTSQSIVPIRDAGSSRGLRSSPMIGVTRVSVSVRQSPTIWRSCRFVRMPAPR